MRMQGMGWEGTETKVQGQKEIPEKDTEKDAEKGGREGEKGKDALVDIIRRGVIRRVA